MIRKNSKKPDAKNAQEIPALCIVIWVKEQFWI